MFEVIKHFNNKFAQTTVTQTPGFLLSFFYLNVKIKNQNYQKKKFAICLKIKDQNMISAKVN